MHFRRKKSTIREFNDLPLFLDYLSNLLIVFLGTTQPDLTVFQSIELDTD